MLDIHTHILPEMDDGSKSVRQSMVMLRREKKQRVDRIVLTPHFYAERESPEVFLNRRAQAAQKLEEAAAAGKRLPRRYLGAEVAYFNGISRSEEIEALCIEGTRTMLIEMPFGGWNRHVFDEIAYLKECRGIQPIIAHIERYLGYQPLGTVRGLCESNIWIQTNASFFLNWKTSWLAMRMLKKREIHFVGSDCHNTKTRPPNLGEALSAIDKRLGSRAIGHLEQMESRLLEGE